jgi:hypothetical protein
MVSDTIKNQIWANEYVDLGILLPNGDVKSQVFPIVVNGVGNEKKLALQENSKQIKTLDQWISALITNGYPRHIITIRSLCTMIQVVCCRTRFCPI